MRHVFSVSKGGHVLASHRSTATRTILKQDEIPAAAAGQTPS